MIVKIKKAKICDYFGTARVVPNKDIVIKLNNKLRDNCGTSLYIIQNIRLYIILLCLDSKYGFYNMWARWKIMYENNYEN